MLHAIAQGKSKIYRRYIGHRDDKDEKRITAEDDITSLILGPLKFLPAEERGRFWHQLLLRYGPPDLPRAEPVDARMELWQRFRNIERSVEPDLMVHLIWPDKQEIPVIVELKWRSALSGDNQLHVQWDHCLDDQGRQTGFHLFIAPNTSASSAARASEHGDPWDGRLLSADWASIKSWLLHGCVFKTPEGMDWAESVYLTLEKLGIRSFKGFCSISTAPIPAVSGSPVFWQGLRGWDQLKVATVPVKEPPIFFCSQ